MREPSIKWVMIALIVGLTTIVLSYSAYSDLVTNNNATISNEYIAKYQNFQDEHSTYADWGRERDPKSGFGIAWDLLKGFATAIVIGVTALTNLVTQLTSITDILDNLMTDFSQFSILIGMLISIFTVWLTYRAVSEARGTAQS